MAEWFMALWQRMHKRRTNLLFAHLNLCFLAYHDWENEWSHVDEDELGAGATVVEQYEDRHTVTWDHILKLVFVISRKLKQDDAVSWDQILQLVFVFGLA